MDAHVEIISGGLPKTGQTTEHHVGDDGTYQAGWWRGRKIADNRTRFLVKTLDGDDVVIDLASGLMWAADGSKAGCNNITAIAWEAAIDYALALDFAGFTDWRMPNINELGSIVNWDENNPSIDPVLFPNTVSADYKSSTTDKFSVTRAWVVTFIAGQYNARLKTDDDYVRFVRGGV